MRKYVLFQFVIAASMGMLLLQACNKILSVPANAAGQIVTSEVFSDSLNATAGVIGMYASTTTWGYWYPDIYGGLGADELLYNGTSNTTAIAYYRDSLFVGNTTLSSPSTSFWDTYYNNNCIYQANAALEGLAADSLLSTTARNQLMGECKFMRSFFYFYLVNRFGDVPYVTSSNYQVNQRLPRTSAGTVYSNIEQDLLQARQFMQPAYPSKGKQRPNRYTADALLARLYLYRQQWNNAEGRCDSILNSGLYSLVSLDNVFLDQSQEAIWQLGNNSTTYSKVAPASGSVFLPILGIIAPAYSLSPFVIQAFDSGDLRKSHWVASTKIGAITYTYPNKYKNSIFSVSTTTEDLMVFRLAEIYLIRAEARAQQGNLAGAVQDINVIRSRAGLGVVTAGSLTQAMGAVLHERQTELFTEWGHRWFDLKRTDSINAVLGREKPWWPADGHAALYPIPYTDLLYNSNLTQNPGY
jgi:hypothetical protein